MPSESEHTYLGGRERTDHNSREHALTGEFGEGACKCRISVDLTLSIGAYYEQVQVRLIIRQM